MIKKTLDFSRQYKSPRWQKKRLEILERDEYTCIECGNKEEMLHVHHIRYINGRNIWEYDNDMLLTLCESCHSKTHEEVDKLKEIISELDYMKRSILLSELQGGRDKLFSLIFNIRIIERADKYHKIKVLIDETIEMITQENKKNHNAPF